MFCFLDTEFTDFTNMDLISIGLVSEDGAHEFYREAHHISDYRSDFVNQIVMPLLDNNAKSHDLVALDLKDWIDGLPGSDVTIIVDYVGDWQLLDKLFAKANPSKRVYCKMLNQAFMHMLHSRGIHTQDAIVRGYAAMLQGMRDYHDIDPRQHHALVDAKANSYGWSKGYEAAK